MRLNTTAPSPQLQCIPAFSDNYIWLLHDGQHAWVVDPGDAGPVRAALQEQGLILAGILLTHHHHDHTGGVAELVADSGAAVFGPVGEVLPEPVTRVGEGDRLQVLGQDFEVIAVPGHTAGHVAYFGNHVPGGPLLFCGDTLFSGGCGRLFEGTPAQMLASLETSLARMPAEIGTVPKAILMVSGHWEEPDFAVMSSPTPGMVYDYGGFPPETYKIVYPAPGAPDLAVRTAD